jgi:hypothetical protein
MILTIVLALFGQSHGSFEGESCVLVRPKERVRLQLQLAQEILMGLYHIGAFGDRTWLLLYLPCIMLQKSNRVRNGLKTNADL